MGKVYHKTNSVCKNTVTEILKTTWNLNAFRNNEKRFLQDLKTNKKTVICIFTFICSFRFSNINFKNYLKHSVKYTKHFHKTFLI